VTDGAHTCVPPGADAPGDEFTCVCGARYVAVRRRWWSRALRWAPVVFALPPHRDPARPRDTL